MWGDAACATMALPCPCPPIPSPFPYPFLPILSPSQDAHAARLAELRMSAESVAAYARFSDAVAEHVERLRAALQSGRAAATERVWLTRQTQGDLDDRLLVDGAAGDPAVFKRRGLPDAAPYAPGQQLPRGGRASPRLLVFAFDCSASMYRFDGVDGRLSRSCEVAALLMEGLDGFGADFRYTIAAHSGDGAWGGEGGSTHPPALSTGVLLPPTHTRACADAWDVLVPASAPPLTPRDRLEVLGRMAATAQFCASGDATLEAAARAVAEAAQGADLPAGTLDDTSEVSAIPLRVAYC